MSQAVEISDHDSRGLLAVDLSLLLELVRPWARDLSWHLLSIEAVGDVTAVWPAGIVDLDRKAAMSPMGVTFSATHLSELAKLIEQVINCQLVGVDDQNQRRLSISGIDSSLWRIEASESAVLDVLRTSFRNVRYVLPRLIV